jgi:hypothetical protein
MNSATGTTIERTQEKKESRNGFQRQERRGNNDASGTVTKAKKGRNHRYEYLHESIRERVDQAVLDKITEKLEENPRLAKSV